MMTSLATVVAPKWQTARARFRQGRRAGGGGRAVVLGTVAALFWAVVFGVLYRVLAYFRGVEEIGPLLAGKLLGLVLLSFLSILLLSNVVTALSSFFLAKDLDLLVAAPVDWLDLYLAKLGETMLHSSWMVALMAVPIVTAYGVVYDGGWLFPAVVFAVFLPLLTLPAVIGSATTLILVNVFPARRTRDLLSVITIAAAGLLVMLFRLVRPEQLARPEGFRNLLDFLTVLRTPTSPLLPSEWATRSLMGYLVGPWDPLDLVLLWSTAGAFVALGAVLHARLYPMGFTKAQEGAERFVRGWFWQMALAPAGRFLSVAKREFIVKDIKLFFRDTTQWSQLILLAVLVVIYLFNIRALPLFTGEQVPFFFVTLVSFLNLGLAGFVLASIAARFIFPAVSLEGRQMWLLRSSPLDLRALLWSKYWTGTIPLLVLALIITVFTNVLLRATGFMMAVSVGTILIVTLAIAALALGFGALYPQFETENAAQIPTSFGGLVFMMTTVALLAVVIVLEAGPVYAYLQATRSEQPLRLLTPQFLVPLAAVALVCGLATVLPLRIGLRRMEEFEF
jgi:ABC-2 type transport system permease protein